MKIVACIITEVLNAMILSYSTQKAVIIKNFIILGFIMQMDELFASSMIGKDKLQKASEQVLIVQNTKEGKDEEKFVTEAVYMFLKQIYIIFFFYVGPYLVVLCDYFA
mgnify:CR=1 FL=1